MIRTLRFALRYYAAVNRAISYHAANPANRGETPWEP